MVFDDVWRLLFAGSVWASLGVVFIIMMVLNRQRVITHVLHQHQYYSHPDAGLHRVYAYIHFSQYFVIWNGNLPEETFWAHRASRDRGGGSMIIIFGHFSCRSCCCSALTSKSVLGDALWGLLMHYFDLSFNIMPLQHPTGPAALGVA